MPCNKRETDGVSPILIVPPSCDSKKLPSAPRPAMCVVTNSVLLHSPDWLPPVNQPRYVALASMIQRLRWLVAR